MSFERFVPYELDWEKLFECMFELTPFAGHGAIEAILGRNLWARLAGPDAPSWDFDAAWLDIGDERYFVRGAGSAPAVMLALHGVAWEARASGITTLPPIFNAPLYWLSTHDSSHWFFLHIGKFMARLVVHTDPMTMDRADDFIVRRDEQAPTASVKAAAIASYRVFFREHRDGAFVAALLVEAELASEPAESLPASDGAARLEEWRASRLRNLAMALPEGFGQAFLSALDERSRKELARLQQYRCSQILRSLSVLERLAWAVALLVTAGCGLLWFGT